MHPLLRYLKSQQLSQAAFAKKADLSLGHINDIITGHVHCGRKGALKIQKATGGAVTLEELLTRRVRRRKRRTEQTPGCAEERTAARAR
jgi:DNA-binding transcriptional regulator YdaS (Cro superfamily)